jgi:hypothetical protein
MTGARAAGSAIPRAMPKPRVAAGATADPEW